MYDILPQEQISVFIDGCKVTGSVGPPLRDAISENNLRSHLAQKGILSKESFDQIDWQGIYGAMCSFSPRLKLWATKFVSVSVPPTRLFPSALRRTPLPALVAICRML